MINQCRTLLGASSGPPAPPSQPAKPPMLVTGRLPVRHAHQHRATGQHRSSEARQCIDSLRLSKTHLFLAVGYGRAGRRTGESHRLLQASRSGRLGSRLVWKGRQPPAKPILWRNYYVSQATGYLLCPVMVLRATCSQILLRRDDQCSKMFWSRHHDEICVNI